MFIKCICLVIIYNICLKDEQILRKKNKTNWNIPVPVALDDALEKAVQLDTHSTKSDFVRDVVRRRLEEMGYKPRVFDKQEKTIER